MKRGQKATHRVVYEWDTGLKGKIPCPDEWTANFHADEVRRQADLQGREVKVEVEVIR